MKGAAAGSLLRRRQAGLTRCGRPRSPRRPRTVIEAVAVGDALVAPTIRARARLSRAVLHVVGERRGAARRDSGKGRVAPLCLANQEMVMDLAAAEKKLREAGFFLDRMREQEARASGDQEPFDFYLSAFLNAARTIQYRLVHEAARAGVSYKGWRESWEGGREAPAVLIRYFLRDRDLEVHERGSACTVRYEFTVNGVARTVIETCTEYVSLVGQLLADFRSDHP